MVDPVTWTPPTDAYPYWNLDIIGGNDLLAADVCESSNGADWRATVWLWDGIDTAEPVDTEYFDTREQAQEWAEDYRMEKNDEH